MQRRRLIGLGFLSIGLFSGMLVASEAKVIASDSKKINDACYCWLQQNEHWGSGDFEVVPFVAGERVCLGHPDGTIVEVLNGQVKTLVKRNDHSQDEYAGFGDRDAELLAIKVLSNDALVTVLNTGLVEIFYSIRPGKLQLIWSNELKVSQERERMQERFDSLRFLDRRFYNLAHASEARIIEKEEGKVRILLDGDCCEEILAKEIKEAILHDVRSCHSDNAKKVLLLALTIKRQAKKRFFA